MVYEILDSRFSPSMDAWAVMLRSAETKLFARPNAGTTVVDRAERRFHVCNTANTNVVGSALVLITPEDGNRELAPTGELRDALRWCTSLRMDLTRIERFRVLSAKEGAARHEDGEALSEQERWELSDLFDEYQRFQKNAIPRLECCEEARVHPAIVFTVRVDPDSITGKAWWRTSYHTDLAPDGHYDTDPEGRFCPFCGKPVPKMRRKNPPPAPLCVITDGGYYCDTCGRSRDCLCLPPAAAFEPVPEPETYLVQTGPGEFEDVPVGCGPKPSGFEGTTEEWVRLRKPRS
jgi:hypothetical protein